MSKIGLILEGGGMRGIYTAGVLDFFIHKNKKTSHLCDLLFVGGEGQLPTISEFFIYIPNYCKKLYLRRGFNIDELYLYNNLIWFTNKKGVFVGWYNIKSITPIIIPTDRLHIRSRTP